MLGGVGTHGGISLVGEDRSMDVLCLGVSMAFELLEADGRGWVLIRLTDRRE
jgi:hypothetical protein